MDKNVGSVDLEELKRAREELNQERGIETDPNMYNSYNPNRESEKSDVVSDASETSIDDVYDNLDDSTDSSSNYEQEQTKTYDESYGTSNEDETVLNDNYQISSNDDTLTENVVEDTFAEQASTTQNPSEDDIDKLDGQELLKLLLGDSYDELEQEDSDLGEEPIKKESTIYDEDPNADDDIYSIKRAAQVHNELVQETPSQIEPVQEELVQTESNASENVEVTEEKPASEKAINLSQFEITDENSDNGLSVKLPNVDENKPADKNFNVYDNFASFEVHYDPSQDEVQNEEFEEEQQEDNSIDLIKSILYSDDSDYVEEKPAESNNAEEQKVESEAKQTTENEAINQTNEPEINENSSETSEVQEPEKQPESENVVENNNQESDIVEEDSKEETLTENVETETAEIENVEPEPVETKDEVEESSEENITEILTDFSKLRNLNQEISNNKEVLETEQTNKEENIETQESFEEENIEDLDSNEENDDEEDEVGADIDLDAYFAHSSDDEDSQEDEEQDSNSVENEKENPYVNIKDFGFINAISNSEFKDSDKFEFLIGKNEDDLQVFADLEKGYNLAVFSYGENEGTYNLINSTILSLMLKNNPDEFKMVICDSDDESKYEIYNQSSYLFTSIAKNNNEVLDNLIKVNQELELRYKTIASINASSIENYNEIAEREQFTKIPYLMVYVLNYSRISSLDNSYRINSLLQSILKFGRLAGIYVILQSYENDLSDGLNYNLSSRIAFKTEIEEDSIYSIGATGAELLQGSNDILYSKIDTSPVHLKVPKFTEKELKLIIQNIEN